MLLTAYAIQGAFVLGSAVFIALGLLIKTYPVPLRNLYVKIFIAVALVRACNAAFAYYSGTKEDRRTASGAEA